jgi:hypothetical protein
MSHGAGDPPFHQGPILKCNRPLLTEARPGPIFVKASTTVSHDTLAPLQSSSNRCTIQSRQSAGLFGEQVVNR